MELSRETNKLSTCIDHNNRSRNRYHYSEQMHQPQHPKNRIVKMFSKVQVVYYLTRNGHLEHPHYVEVSHLATQPLRLKDVIERLTILRGKAMPCQYSWSCKRSYKNGYVWNDLTENDAIYASDGSEYVLKGSELMQDRDFSEIGLEEHQSKGRKQNKSINNSVPDTNGLITSKANQRHSFRQSTTNHVEQQNGNNEAYESEEDEKRVSCNSSTAIYSKPMIDDSHIMMQLEQEESYSHPSTSSTISDKPPQPDKPLAATSKRFEESVVIEEDGDPHSTALIRNPVLLQLIACGGAKVRKNVKGGNKSDFNINIGSTFMPCLKQQLSTREVDARGGYPVYKVAGSQDSRGSKAEKSEIELSNNTKVVDDDPDMILVRYMSENPRFGNLQSQEKEYFSGTVVETMIESGTGQDPVFTKSSSYNELRSAKGGLEAVASKAVNKDGKGKVKAKGMIKLCLPRKKSCLSNSTKSNKL